MMEMLMQMGYRKSVDFTCLHDGLFGSGSLEAHKSQQYVFDKI